MHNPIQINKNGLCNDCQSNNRQIDHCLQCGEPFDYTHLNDDGLCSRCEHDDTLGHCMGCGSKFIARSNKSSAYCASCESKLKRGECLSCGRTKGYKFLNEYGICNLCIWDRKGLAKYKCTHCGERDVFSQFDVCDHCKKDTMKIGRDD